MHCVYVVGVDITHAEKGLMEGLQNLLRAKAISGSMDGMIHFLSLASCLFQLLGVGFFVVNDTL